MSYIFNPQRATRLVQQKAMDANQLGLSETIEMINDAINSASVTNGYHEELNRAVIDQFTTALMRLASSSQTSATTRAIAMNKLMEWSNYEPQQEMGIQKAFMLAQVHKINQFLDDPTEYESVSALSPPDGSPIGTDLMDWCNFQGN